jgi:hypothetical protein
VDKKRARLNCIHHLLSQVPYQEIERETVTLPARVHNPDYLRNPVPEDMFGRRCIEAIELVFGYPRLAKSSAE